MILFATKMYGLTRMRSSEFDDKHSERKDSKMVFNEQQRQLLYTTTKYVTLLLISMITSCISLSFVVVELNINGNFIWDIIIDVLISIDSLCGIICLFLQYPFNKKFYDKYCICFSKCCIYLLATNERKKSMMNIHITASPSTPNTAKDIDLSQQKMKLSFNRIASNSGNHNNAEHVNMTTIETAEDNYNEINNCAENVNITKSSHDGNVQRNHDHDESFLNRTMEEVLRQESENTRKGDENVSEIP